MKKKSLGRHKIALAALFTVGNLLLRYPRTIGSAYLLWWALGVGLSALLPALLLYPLFCRAFHTRLWGHPMRCGLALALSVAVIGAALLCAYRAFSDELAAAVTLVLPGAAPVAFAVLFSLCIWSLASLKRRGLDAAALLGLGAVVLGAILLFAFGLPHYELPHLGLSMPQDGALLRGVLWDCFWNVFLPLSVLSCYFALCTPRAGGGYLAIGAALGCGTVWLCVLQTVCTFGVAYAAEMAFPYAQAVRILSVGQYFFRLEGVAYFSNYLTCLFRASICLATVRRLIARFLPMRARWCLPLLCVALPVAFWFVG